MADHRETSALVAEKSAPVVATIVNGDGVQRVATPDLRQYLAAGFFWLDLAGSDDAARAAFLHEAGLAETDSAWMRRFGQSERMTIGSESLRVVTKLSEALATFTEFHLWGSRRCVVTVWNGDGSALNDIRSQFAERAEDLAKSPYQAAAVLLQFMLGTLDEATSEIDTALQTVREQIEQSMPSVDLASLTRRLEKLQMAWSAMDRYSSSVRTATVAVDALPQIDQRAATELRDYADRVDDNERRLHERYQRGAGLLQNYATAIAQRQGDQINRLTLVSVIFLPITFLTGFFGMNFDWMIKLIGSPAAFMLLGVLLPAASIALTVLWFKRRELI